MRYCKRFSLSNQVRSGMILHTLFMKFVALKTSCKTISRQHRKEGCSNTSTGSGGSRIFLKVEAPSYYLAKCFMKTAWKQECIPVGCVPADRRPYAGVCFQGGRGVSAPGGVLHSRGVCSKGGVWSGGVCSGGVSGRGGSPCRGGLARRTPPGWENPSPPVNRMTNKCKNITLAKTSFRPVMKEIRPRAGGARIPRAYLGSANDWLRNILTWFSSLRCLLLPRAFKAIIVTPCQLLCVSFNQIKFY